MKIRKLFVAVLAALVSMLGMAETATVDGLLWQYSVSDGKATVEKLLTPGVENVVIPGEINGCKVVTIGEKAFYRDENIRTVVIPEGVTVVGGQAFFECVNLLDAKLPSTLKRIESVAFCNSSLRHVRLPGGLEFLDSLAFHNDWSMPDSAFMATLTVEGSVLAGEIFDEHVFCSFCSGIQFLGHVPKAMPDKDDLANFLHYNSNWPGMFSYPKKYAEEWSKIIPPELFGGYVPENPCVITVISKMREDVSTIMDVKFTPASVESEVRIRPVAFRNGVNSFANVVKVKTFADGTESVVQNPVKANQESVFSWNVAADLTDKVAKLKMDVMCVEDDVLPLELVTIPASSGHAEMTISRNGILPMRIRDALMWIMASPAENISVSVTRVQDAKGKFGIRFVLSKDGSVIYGDDSSVFEADGTWKQSWWSSWRDISPNLRAALDGAGDLLVCGDSQVKRFVLEELGYTILEGDDLEYARKMTGLKLENGPYVKMK